MMTILHETALKIKVLDVDLVEITAGAHNAGHKAHLSGEIKYGGGKAQGNHANTKIVAIRTTIRL